MSLRVKLTLSAKIHMSVSSLSFICPCISVLLIAMSLLMLKSWSST